MRKDNVMRRVILPGHTQVVLRKDNVMQRVILPGHTQVMSELTIVTVLRKF